MHLAVEEHRALQTLGHILPSECQTFLAELQAAHLQCYTSVSLLMGCSTEVYRHAHCHQTCCLVPAGLMAVSTETRLLMLATCMQACSFGCGCDMRPSRWLR